MSNNDIFRVCPDTGLKFHRPAEALMKANAVAAVVFLREPSRSHFLRKLRRSYPSVP